MNKPCIICADDEVFVLNSLKEQIKFKFGAAYNIETAASGYETVELYKELIDQNTDVPLIICDYIMPDRKGDDVLRSIHEIDASIFPPACILLTGQATLEGIKNAVNWANIFKLICKPWDEQLLYENIQNALDSYNKEKVQAETYHKLKETNKQLKDAFKIKYVHKITQDLCESLTSIKNGLAIIKSYEISTLNEDFQNPSLYIKDLETYLANISNSIIQLSTVFEDNESDLIPELGSYQKVSAMYNEVSKIKADVFDGLDTMSKKIHGFERLLKREPKKIAAWDGEDILLLNIDDILYFSSSGRNIIASTKSSKYRVKKTITELEESLKEYNFFRCHKSYLVNLKYIKKIVPWLGYDSYMSTIEGSDCEIPISRNYIKDMKRIFDI